MNFPDNLKYTKDHEWVLVDGDVATIGVTNSDPYGDGWMVKVKMSNPAEVDGLMSHADYVAMVG